MAEIEDLWHILEILCMRTLWSKAMYVNKIKYRCSFFSLSFGWLLVLSWLFPCISCLSFSFQCLISHFYSFYSFLLICSLLVRRSEFTHMIQNCCIQCFRTLFLVVSFSHVLLFGGLYFIIVAYIEQIILPKLLEYVGQRWQSEQQ